jgi:signal-transduction protein with cAMP-binding, CBS, and nucleotidyltransferase domain
MEQIKLVMELYLNKILMRQKQAKVIHALIKEIKKKSHASKDSVADLTNLIQSKNTTLTVLTISQAKLICHIKEPLELVILDLAPPARFAWLSIAVQGRKEQLLLTDQDSIYN